MKTLNLLPVWTRLSVFSAAIAVVAALAFVSSASAAEKKFDALGGVTAEALTPAAMDEIQGMGSIHVSYHAPGDTGASDQLIYFAVAGPREIKGPVNIWIRLEKSGRDKVFVLDRP